MKHPKDMGPNEAMAIIEHLKEPYRLLVWLMPGTLISELERQIASIRKAWKEKDLSL